MYECFSEDVRWTDYKLFYKLYCFIRIRVDRRSIVNMRLGCRWSGSEPHEVGDLLI